MKVSAQAVHLDYTQGSRRAADCASRFTPEQTGTHFESGMGAGPHSQTQSEICAALIVRLAGGIYRGIQAGIDPQLVLYDHPKTKSTLATRLDRDFCAQTIRRHLAEHLEQAIAAPVEVQ